jgi:hypothetical protein
MDMGETDHFLFESSLVMFGSSEGDKISPPDIGELRIGRILNQKDMYDMHHLGL